MDNIIYEEDIVIFFDALNKAMELSKDKPKEKGASTMDVLIQQGYTVVSKKNIAGKDIVDIRSFIPRYINLIRKERKNEKKVIEAKKTINDFIAKYKMSKIN